MDGLAGLVAFVHAVEQRSYVAAARILGVSASAVSKSVARLETRLGVRLLSRTTRSIDVTEEVRCSTNDANAFSTNCGMRKPPWYKAVRRPEAGYASAFRRSSVCIC
ncbi:LysR family transcriptional regulator [Xanthomonas hyacinthi]|uniref:helix-turn-helix domain-containing protein n=1 Tax=Xanthomonas hyacinthi TaxID=56455 RepID=UPI001FCB6661|nr:LysR family transcriptional regulator [Xanthomonas hyacinthi]